VVSYSIPYLLNAPYAALGPKIGFIFSGTTLIGLVYAYFCVPDCRSRSLEDIDRLFYNKVPARKFHKTNIDSLALVGEDDFGNGLKMTAVHKEHKESKVEDEEK